MNTNSEKSIINQLNNNNSIINLKNLNHPSNSSTIKISQGVADLSSNLNGSNLINNLNSILIKNHNQNQTNNKDVNAIDKLISNTNKNKASNKNDNLDLKKNSIIITNLPNKIENNHQNNIVISEINENPNDKVLVRNLFKEYKIKNTNDKKKLIVIK